MPTVSLDFEGNESDLINSTKNVGTAFDKLGDNTKGLQDDTRNTGAAFETMGEGADTAETRFTGFYDTLGGTRDAFSALGDSSLSTSDKLIALGQAGADLAGGLADFVIPMVRSLWTRLMETAAAQYVLTAAQTVWNGVTAAGTVVMNLLNAAFRANPIGFVITVVLLLIGVFTALWEKSAGFRDFFIGMWNGFKSIVGGVVDFIKAVWNGIPGFFTGVVNGIKSVFSGIGDFMLSVFKGAVNAIITVINGVIWVINKIIDGLNLVPFVDIPHIPTIKKLQTGGRAMRSGLAFLHEGETVRSASESARGGSGASEMRITGSGGLFEMIYNGVRNGDIQLVDGSGNAIRVS
jgi:phage-related protein